jgi:hypothetical protein
MDEAHEMASILEHIRRPCGREYWELIRSGKEGSYWQAADGLIVRLCVAEAAHEAQPLAEMHRSNLVCCIHATVAEEM